jgi:hypothetical protein
MSRSGRLDHCPQARCADFQSLGDSVDDKDARLNVRFEHAIGASLGKAYIAAELGRLAADITFAGHL